VKFGAIPVGAALERLAANGDALAVFDASAIADRRDVISAAIEAMGVGGLLTEIASRPRPRLGDV
jgi:BioD-like phosphotransacetylase family protein